MFGFIKKCFFTPITFFSYNTLNVNSLEYLSMNNQECKIRSEIINVSTLCVPHTIENINVKVFNLMSRTNEARHIEWHKTCKM